MTNYDLTHLEDYFQEWYSPTELVRILHRVAMNMSIACLSTETAEGQLKTDLEDLRTFIVHIERVQSLN